MSSSGSRSSGPRPHDIKKQSELTSLYNSPVVHYETVKRPIGGSLFGVPHKGGLATLENGQQYLVHKGPGYGGAGGDHVVVDAKHMSSEWKQVPGSSVEVNKVPLGRFVEAPQGKYGVIRNNCYDAANKMENVARGNKKK